MSRICGCDKVGDLDGDGIVVKNLVLFTRCEGAQWWILLSYSEIDANKKLKEFWGGHTHGQSGQTQKVFEFSGR